MKKILSILILCVLCALMTACGTDSYQPAFPDQAAAFWPEAPKKLKEVIRYEYSEDGFYIVKEYFDRKGNRLEEHYYNVDDTLGVLDCKIVAYNTVDKKGNLVKTEGHYISNPYHTTRETVLVIEAIEHETFDYKVLDEDGNITLYIKETKNEKGKVIREEYFTKGGRLIRTEEFDYRSDSTLSAYRGKNARNDVTYEATCNDKGNVTSCTKYDEAGKMSGKIFVDYYENGTIKDYSEVPVYKDGSLSETKAVTTFYEDGRIKTHLGRSYGYTEDGKLMTISHMGDYYSFNRDGYLTSYRGKANGQIGTDIGITYTYDSQGRLTLCVTKNGNNSKKTSVSYQYLPNGAMTVSHTNVYGITNNVIYTDTKGRIVKNEIYNNVSRTSYQTIEYDTYGNVIRTCDYDKEALSSETLFEYNEHGDLINTEKISYSSSGSSTVRTEYTYFDNGYVKCYETRDRWGLSEKRVYEADGGYTHTEYVLGEATNEFTYDKYGNQIKNVYFGKEYAEIITREFYSDGSEKKIMVYHDDVLQHGAEYDEEGVEIKKHERDENGVIITTAYTYEDNRWPVREDIYKDGVYAGYTAFTYFEINPHIVKTRTEYNADGQTVYHAEYADYLKPTKEEFYENGVLVSYVYHTYLEFDGRLKVDIKEEYKNGIVRKEDYDYDDAGKIIGSAIFENGQKISYSTYYHDPDRNFLKLIKTYDVNGNVIEIRENDSNGYLHEMYRYEYYADGTLRLMTKWWEPSGSKDAIMTEKTEYLENGAISLEEEYNASSQLIKKRSYVYLESGALDYIEINENGKISYLYYRYGQNGKLLKTEAIANGAVTEYTDFLYDENGILREEQTYNVSENRQEAVKLYDEYGRLVKECGRPSKTATDSEYVWGDEFTYLYGENGRVAEKCHKNINQISLWIERYEYHENGEISVLRTYWKDASGTERPNDTEYFDTDGNKIYR